MIIDFHVHIDETENTNVNGIPVKMGRNEILVQMRDAGVDLSVLLVMARKGDIDKVREQNDWLAKICNGESKFVGFGSVHPDDGDDALSEMDRCIDSLELKGFKLHPNTQHFDMGSQSILQILNKAAELDVPVIIDSYSPWDDAQPSKFFDAALKCNETKICLAHVGMWRFIDFGTYGFIKQRTAIPLNVYFDLSASILLFYKSPFQEQFRWITELIGEDNLLFGSDFPLFLPKEGEHFPLCSVKHTLDIIRDFGYPESWMPKILGQNAAKLLKL